MCCVLEIAMTVMGIVTLVKGSFKLSKNRVVYGGRAYLIGLLLTLTFPLAFGTGIVVGIVIAMNDPAGEPDMFAFVWLDAAFVLGIFAIVFMIAATGNSGRGSHDHPRQGEAPPLRPTELNHDNPYASPRSEPSLTEQHWEEWMSATDQPLPPPTDAAPPLPSASPQVPPSGQTWYYSLDGKSGQGPISTSALKQLIAVGTLTRDTLVSSDGKSWRAAEKLKGVKWP